MNPIQFLIIIFILFVITKQSLKLYRRQVDLNFFILWLVFWFTVAVVTIEPGIINYLADQLGVGRGADLALYASILVIFYALFRILVRLEKLEKKQIKLVQKIALQQAHSKVTKEIKQD